MEVVEPMPVMPEAVEVPEVARLPEPEQTELVPVVEVIPEA